MLTVFRDNPVLAELDIFVTQPDQQWLLIESLIAYTHDILKQQPGYIANAIHRSLDGLRVVNYVQWQSQANYEAYINNREIALATKITGFFTPDSHE
jgi:heme-degrading monooxygenase HmoA